ncbi:hypothetical protein Sjap_023380 [Stephania japonica]|uniref:Uncharacterized protein n=1 Tax=Stephania japonica TaxID=461633 RepID=A0AAP0EIR6_9MAGN
MYEPEDEEQTNLPLQQEWINLFSTHIPYHDLTETFDMIHLIYIPFDILVYIH